jgi:hypothetical protein
MIRKKNGSANRNRKKESGNSRGTLRPEISVSGAKASEPGNKSSNSRIDDTRNTRRSIRPKGKAQQSANKLGHRNHSRPTKRNRLSSSQLCDPFSLEQAFHKFQKFLLKDRSWIESNNVQRVGDSYSLFGKYEITKTDKGWRVTKTGIDQGYFFRGTSAWAWCDADRRPGFEDRVRIRELDRQIGFIDSDLANIAYSMRRSRGNWHRDLLDAKYSELKSRRVQYSEWLEKYLNRTKYLELRTLK